MDIEEIKEKVKLGEYEISYHAEKERYAEDITLFDLESAIFNGEILESYAEWIRIITVYLPKQPKWIDERTRAKEGELNA